MRALLLRVSPLVYLLACSGDLPSDKADDTGSDNGGGENAGDSGTGDSGDSGTGDSGDSGTGDSGDSGDSGAVDADHDGYAVGEDCDDTDANVHPGADERCNGEDDDCDSVVDEDPVDATAWYDDDDADGYGAGEAVLACEQPAGMVADATDCNDRDDTVHPDATEVCDGVDQDCDGILDEGSSDGVAYYTDADRDGFGAGAALAACGQPAGTVLNDEDCDDARAAVNPDATEVCNGVDDNCDGVTDTDATDRGSWYADTDSDGYGAGAASLSCSAPSGYVANAADCDDADRTVHPGATETCNGVDDDCDGSIDEGASDAYTLYIDRDSDGFGTGAATTSCTALSGYSTSSGDCDDANADVNPDATEVCNGIDDDCNGTADGADAADAITVWPDVDRDGYGAGRSSAACSVTAGFATNGADCDDTDRAVNPAADEQCNGIDDDCDGTVDEADAVDAVYGFADADHDGFGDPDDYDVRCDGVGNAYDCDDGDPSEPQMVDAASGSSAPDGSIREPWAAIQDGIDHADQCVLVADGLYSENVDFHGRDILVSSQHGSGSTVIDGGGGGAVARFSTGEAAGAELRGFTLTNGSGYFEETSETSSCGSSTTCTNYYVTLCGGGVFVDGATPSLVDLVIQANNLSVPADYTVGNDTWTFYSFGGGLCVRNASLVVTGLDVWENYAEDGGGVFVDSTAALEFRQGTVLANNADSGGGFEVDGGSLTLVNALVAWNVATTAGGGVYGIDADVSFTNVTLGECEAASGGALEASGTTSLSVLNSIIYGADAGYGILVGAGGTYSGSYSDVYGNAAGNYSGVSDPTGTTGNISADPLFVGVSDDGDYSNDDWSLGSGSTCINHGSSIAVYNDVDGTRNDQGAYGGPGGDWE